MNARKKLIAVFLTAAVLTVLSVAMFAGNEAQPIADINEQESTLPYFYSYQGTVKEINIVGDRIYYGVEKDGEIIANIIADKETYIVGNQEIKKGDVIEGFYDGRGPMLMIYPPQVTAEVITVNFPEAQSIKADKFDADLLSADGELKLNISDDTDVVLQDGTPFDGELANRKLAVIYSITTRSIPAQTSPEKVIVLFENAVPAVGDVAPEVPAGVETEDGILILDDISLNGQIFWGDIMLEAPEPYVNANGVVMVPLRAVAEEMGYDVTWEQSTKGVFLGNSFSLYVGRDYYTYMRTAPIELGAAPELMDGRTYVPLSFFSEVMRLNNTYVFEGQIILGGQIGIENEEIME